MTWLWLLHGHHPPWLTTGVIAMTLIGGAWKALREHERDEEDEDDEDD